MGVCERGETVRAEVVKARPRVTEGSREGAEAARGGSIWCDGFRACARGEEAGTITQGSVQYSTWGTGGQDEVKKFRATEKEVNASRSARPRHSSVEAGKYKQNRNGYRNKNRRAARGFGVGRGVLDEEEDVSRQFEDSGYD